MSHVCLTKIAQQNNLRLSMYSDVDFGDYYALVIGNNEYEHLELLETAVDDALVLASVLKTLWLQNDCYKRRQS